MAEGFFRDLTKDRGGYEALSAGIGAMNGQPPSEHAVRALAEENIDITAQRSCQLTAEMVAGADFIFGMTRGHIEAVLQYFPQAADKAFLIREFVQDLPLREKDIADPIGGDLEIYKQCRDQIKQGIDALMEFVEKTFAVHYPDPTAWAADCRC